MRFSQVVYTSSGLNVSISTIPGFSCRKLMSTRENFPQQVRETMKKQNYECAILLGKGDMVVMPAGHELAEKVKSEVAKTEEELGICYSKTIEGMDLYMRTKPSVSRKKILPMVKDALKK